MSTETWTVYTVELLSFGNWEALDGAFSDKAAAESAAAATAALYPNTGVRIVTKTVVTTTYRTSEGWTPKVTRPRIDKLTPGQGVRVRFTGTGEEEDVTFNKITGTGEERRASFISCDERTGLPQEWEAYRYNGGWAYGSSAERLSLVRALTG